MKDPSLGSDLLAGLADEFAERFRRGERPEPSEYAEKYPDLADQIRDLFPALAVMEQFGSVGGGTRPFVAWATHDVPRQLGEYLILREVGRGGMGVVYEAVQKPLGRHVALKLLPSQRLLQANQLERFRHEARAAARLHHTNIVPVFGVGEVEDVHYYAMQFIQGQSLDVVLHELRRLRAAGASAPESDAQPRMALAPTLAEGLTTGRFPDRDRVRTEHRAGQSAHTADSASSRWTWGSRTESKRHSDLTALSGSRYIRSVAQIGLQVAEALDYAHQQGVLHRDIKPSNVLLDTQGTAWITDFGLAKTAETDGLTFHGDIVGTLCYMAPERFRGHSDCRSDIYALGTTLYELLTLRPAFPRDDELSPIDRIVHGHPKPPRQIERDVPRDLETIVLKAMAKEPATRYATADAMAEDLRRFLEGRTILARRSSAPEHVWRWCRRNPLVAGLAIVVIMLLLTIAVGSSVSAARLTANLKRAEGAEHVALKNLWNSYLAQARAGRYSGRPGQRFDGLESLARAARLGVFPDRRGELRDEAIACLALADLRPLQVLARQSLDEYRVAFDAAFERYAVSDADCNVSLRRVKDDVEIARFPRVGPVPRLSWVVLRFSPDGRRLAIGYDFDVKQSSVQVWDLRSAPPTCTLTLPDASLFDFDPDGRRLAVGRSDGTIGLFDPASGRELGRFETGFASPHRHFQFAFRPDGRQVAVNSRVSHEVHVLDVESGALVARLDHPAVTHKFAWRFDGRRLAVGCNDRSIHVWDPGAPRRPLTRLVGHEDQGLSVAFSPGGDVLLSTAWDNTTRLWDAERGRPLLRAVPGVFLAFSDDGSRVALRRSNRIEIWELALGRECRLLPHAAASVDFRADGLLLATGGRDVACWDAASGQQVARLPAGPNAAVAFRPVGHELVTFGEETGLLRWASGAAQGRPWDTHSPGASHIRKRPGGDGSEQACWSAEGRLLAVADGARGDIVILDGETGNERNRLRPALASLAAISLVPSAEAAGRIPLCGYMGAPPRVRVAVSPDGRWVAASHDQESSPFLPALPAVLTVWDVASGRTRTLPGSLPSDHLAFSPDSRWLVLGGVNNYRFYSTATWQAGPVLRRSAGESTPGHLAFARTGSVLAIARTLTDVQLVHPTTGRTLATLQAPEPRQVSCLCFSPDGGRLAIATTGDHVQLWDLRLIRRQLASIGLDWN